MDYTKGRIAILDRINNNAHCKQIIYLIDGLILINHLLVNAKEVLSSSVYLCINISILDMLSHIIY